MKYVVLFFILTIFIFNSFAFHNNIYQHKPEKKLKIKKSDILSELSQDIKIAIFLYNLKNKLSDVFLAEAYTTSLDKIELDSNTAINNIFLLLPNNPDILKNIKDKIKNAPSEIKGGFYQFTDKLYEKLLLKTKKNPELKKYIPIVKSIKAECINFQNIDIRINLSSKKLIEKFHFLLVTFKGSQKTT